MTQIILFDILIRVDISRLLFFFVDLLKNISRNSLYMHILTPFVLKIYQICHSMWKHTVGIRKEDPKYFGHGPLAL